MSTIVGAGVNLGPVRVPLPLTGRVGYLEFTYQDNDIRITRGNRFVIVVFLQHYYVDMHACVIFPPDVGAATSHATFCGLASGRSDPWVERFVFMSCYLRTPVPQATIAARRNPRLGSLLVVETPVHPTGNPSASHGEIRGRYAWWVLLYTVLVQGFLLIRAPPRPPPPFPLARPPPPPPRGLLFSSVEP